MGAEGPDGPVIGVCLVRMERQAEHLLITVTSSPDVSRGAQDVRSTVHPAVALAVVKEFMERFAVTPP